MALGELKEAIMILIHRPLLWTPGIVGGSFAALIWLSLFIAGAFFTSRLVVIFVLVLLFFTTGMLSAIRQNEATVPALVAGGRDYYFRVLLPQIVIGSGLFLVFIVCTIVFALLGLASDIGLISALTFGIMIPPLMLTFFSDTAAVFEDRRVFESIRRSILLVSSHMGEVLSFFAISAFLCAGALFALMIIWEALLYEKLQPILDFTEAEIAAFTPGQLIAMIGPEGMWITAVMLFAGSLILLPLLFSYKACFFKKIASRSAVTIEQTTYGEYDSKGRWYKY